MSRSPWVNLFKLFDITDMRRFRSSCYATHSRESYMWRNVKRGNDLWSVSERLIVSGVMLLHLRALSACYNVINAIPLNGSHSAKSCGDKPAFLQSGVSTILVFWKKRKQLLSGKFHFWISAISGGPVTWAKRNLKKLVLAKLYIVVHHNVKSSCQSKIT